MPTMSRWDRELWPAQTRAQIPPGADPVDGGLILGCDPAQPGAGADRCQGRDHPAAGEIYDLLFQHDHVDFPKIFKVLARFRQPSRELARPRQDSLGVPEGDRRRGAVGTGPGAAALLGSGSHGRAASVFESVFGSFRSSSRVVLHRTEPLKSDFENHVDQAHAARRRRHSLRRTAPPDLSEGVVTIATSGMGSAR